jgi:hypothetical protein
MVANASAPTAATTNQTRMEIGFRMDEDEPWNLRQRERLYCGETGWQLQLPTKHLCRRS